MILIVQLELHASNAAIQEISSFLHQADFSSKLVNTFDNRYIVCLSKKESDIRKIGFLPGVKDVFRVSDDYPLVSGKWKMEPTCLHLGDGVQIGGGKLSIMTGPCSIESEAQIEESIKHLVANGVKIMRGGVFKPRSSPYSFRGVGLEGLKMWYDVARSFGIKIITEVMEIGQIEPMAPYTDIFQVGARNTQNFNLLDELGKIDKPVMIKRGISGTIDELLYSAEYIFSAGNEKILLCERGIRTYENASRNTFDINAIPILKQKSHLPVIADPSHGIGIRALVSEIALAAIMAGADGVIYESHVDPYKALSDGQQTLNFVESTALIEKMRRVHALRQELALV